MFATSSPTSTSSLYERVFRGKYSLAASSSDRSSPIDVPDAPTDAATSHALHTETQSLDPWVSRARPTFLYVIYAIILWALPMGLVAAVSPRISHAITTGMTDYLAALPAELYTLFGTGYLGYATLRQWGKTRGTDR